MRNEDDSYRHPLCFLSSIFITHGDHVLRYKWQSSAKRPQVRTARCPWASATAWPLPLVPGGTYTPVGCSLASAWSTRLQHICTSCVGYPSSHPSNVCMWVCCIVSSQYFLETNAQRIIVVTIINIIIRVNNDLPGLLMFILYIYILYTLYLNMKR